MLYRLIQDQLKYIYFILQPVWLNPITPSDHSVAYDSSMCMQSKKIYEARKLLNHAYTTSLTIPLLTNFVTQLQNDPMLVYHMGLTPEKVSYALVFLQRI